MFSFDGGSKVSSIARRGFLSLRVVLQMLPWLQKSYTCGDDKSYPLIPVICVRDAEALRIRCLESRVGDAATWEACWCSWTLRCRRILPGLGASRGLDEADATEFAGRAE